jgi:predicted dehydrogenase
MVGGGRDAFIGAVHRMAAGMDGLVDLVCGAFSSTPEKSRASGRDLFLPEDRVYGTFQEMFEKESKRPEDRRMDFVSVVTPNYMHFPPAKMALESGFSVVCDKPMTFDLDEAKQLEALVEKTGLLFCLTHNYTGYPMVKQARQLVRAGQLGKIRKVVVQYPQDWLATREETGDNKQAAWRTDPKRAGATCCMGDIGSHAENLVEYITDLEVEELCADFTTFVSGRPLEDDANCLIHYRGGARGVLIASQISIGEENGLRIRVYGEEGGLVWAQQEPNTLIVNRRAKPSEIYRTGGGYVGERSSDSTRLPAGHPEGYLEGFANLYRSFAMALGSRLDGVEPKPEYLDFPDVKVGVKGMAFLATVVQSGKSGKWLQMLS